MKDFYSVIIFHLLICLTSEGAEYVEAPFQKFGVMLTQKPPRKFSSEIFPMVMFGEKFLCDLPSEEEILFARNIIYPDVSILTEKINAMPCLLYRQSEWTHLVCPYIIYQIHNRNFTRNILGIRYTDNYKQKRLEGFWSKGDQTIFTRHFIGPKICGASKEDVQTIAWYFCRQSKQEDVFLQQLSSCEYEIRIYTPRVCSGFDFESTTGHQLHCYAEKDAMALVLANEDRIESPRYSFSSEFLVSPKGFRGDVFFVKNANFSLNEDSNYEEPSNSNKEKTCEKKSSYTADEMMSATMGMAFNFSVDSQNESGHVELIWKVMSFLYPDEFYKRGVFNLYPFHSMVENIKKMIRTLKKDEKRKVSMAVGLQCYRCGKYTPDGTGSVIPCYTYNQTDLKECRPRDKYCLKYLNEGIVVRDCAYECKTGVHELSEFFCCQEDGCNTAPTPLRPAWTVLLVVVHLALWGRYLT